MTTTITQVEDYKTAKHCFYIPGKPYVQSGAFLFSDGKYYSPHDIKTLDDMKKENPDVIMITWDEAFSQIDEIDNVTYSIVKEIDKERFNEMLNVLPPMDWQNVGGASTFLISEATSGGFHACFVKNGGKFYEGYSNRYKENAGARVKRFLTK